MPEFAARLLEVQIECADFEYVLDAYDCKDTLFYLDPPYVGENILFNDIEFGHDDHIRLLNKLVGLEGMCLLSGYDSDLYYDVLELQHGWYYTEKIRIFDSKLVGRGSRVESLWLNAQAVRRGS